MVLGREPIGKRRNRHEPLTTFLAILLGALGVCLIGVGLYRALLQ